jgi:hypothetical protein
MSSTPKTDAFIRDQIIKMAEEFLDREKPKEEFDIFVDKDGNPQKFPKGQQVFPKQPWRNTKR